jgi:Tfp pilus assembly protein PilO
METINIEVSSNVAEAYRNFAVNQRQQIEGLINSLLSQLIQERSLDIIIDDMQQQAMSNGLTEEILAEILKDE